MAEAVILPRLGSTVESCIIRNWVKHVGDDVAQGDVLCEVETDKATMEVESPHAGTLLAHFFEEGHEVAVLSNIAAVGRPGEDVAHLRPQAPDTPEASRPAGAAPPEQTAAGAGASTVTGTAEETVKVSPRARRLAQREGLALEEINGSGPAGRIIERDVQAALAERPQLTPVAQRMVAQGDYTIPAQGTGTGGRIRSQDLVPTTGPPPEGEDDVEVVPVEGVRKVIAERMLQSVQTTAQLTLNARVDARALLAYRERLKQSREELDLHSVTINDLIHFAVARTLPDFPELNAHFKGDVIERHRRVHLGFAVDTPRGLLVPVIHNAHALSLRRLAAEARRLAEACQEESVTPDELSGGTFTVSNLGKFGIESFTPVLNPPQVAILGLGSIDLKPVGEEGQVSFVPHLGLSLTINHQAVDGAPGARFLQALARNLADLELLLAL